MLIKRLIEILLFILFFVCPIGAQSPPTQQEIVKPVPKQERTTTSSSPANHLQHQIRSSNHQPNSDNPIIPAKEPKPVVESVPTQNRYDYEAENLKVQRQLANSTKAIAYFTVALVLVGIIQAIIFLIQVYLWVGTLKATMVAADAAKDSALIARDSLTSIRRAFVSLKRITAKPVMIYRGLNGHEEAQHWLFSPCWVNMGDTPTKKLSISINWKVFEYHIPNDFDFSYDNRPNATTNIPMAIGPKSEVICGAFALNYFRILGPIVGLQNSNLYIWGEAIYDDIFNNPHRTRFCVKMVFLTQQIVGGHDKPTFIFYDRYNCYDDDCDEQS